MTKQARREPETGPFAMFHLNIELRLSLHASDESDDVVYAIAPAQAAHFGSEALAQLFETIADDVAGIRQIEWVEGLDNQDDLSGLDLERAYRALAQMVRRNINDDGFGYGKELQDLVLRRVLEPLRKRQH